MMALLCSSLPHPLLHLAREEFLPLLDELTFASIISSCAQGQLIPAQAGSLVRLQGAGAAAVPTTLLSHLETFSYP